MNTRKRRVLEAITFSRPDRIPIWHFNRDSHKGDIVRYMLAVEVEGTSEWGFKWHRLDDGTMGQVDEPVIRDWSQLDDYEFPTPDHPARVEGFEQFSKGVDDHYVLGGLGISGFTIYTFLRGFTNAMTDFLLSPTESRVMLQRIFDFECQLIRIARQLGLDGIHFEDDWGTQQGMMISPSTWREAFKPLYKEQFELVHSLGMHVWFHSCGNIAEIIPDFDEIGVDVMNISQPNVVDLEHVGERLRGQQCFMTPISYQTVSITGGPDEIAAEAERLYATLGTETGGFIGYVEDYSCMGMSERNYKACIDAFEGLNVPDSDLNSGT